MNSFSDLLKLHRQLDDLFQEHQRALLRLNLDLATELLGQYEEKLVAHIRDEEKFMLPLYRERVTAPVGGAVEIFFGEHEKLREFVRLFKEYMEKIRDADDREMAVLFLIDSQHLFKRLLVHHDTRERKMLYPLLDENTTEAERQDLFAKLELASSFPIRCALESVVKRNA